MNLLVVLVFLVLVVGIIIFARWQINKSKKDWPTDEYDKYLGI